MFDIFYFDKPPKSVPFAQQVNSLDEAYKLSRTRYFWIVDYLCDYSEWDFLWEPAPWESEYRHAFASQHQKDSGTYLVPQCGFTQTKYNTTCVPRLAAGIVLITHTTKSCQLEVDDLILHKTRFISDYLGTLRRICQKIQDNEYIWVVSDLCNYTDFDFSWHPEIWQNTMLHVFPSNEQKFGDTFFIHVESFLEKSKDIEVLEWYNPLNFVTEMPVSRKDPELVEFYSDCLLDAVHEHTFSEPVVQFFKQKPETPITISLWQERVRTVVPLNKSGESTLIPRDAKNHIHTQLYDYKWIDNSYKQNNPGTAQDIIFISYDEPNADKNFAVLKSKFPRAKRLHGVEGMVNALKEAAKLSATDYYYAVFAKTRIVDSFNFDFCPDYLKVPSHYLFHGRNMSNGLEYGTLGVTMYNCKLVIDAIDWGVDFTTSFPVQVVPELSALGYFATDPYRAWRTAFRECTKLQSKCIDRQVDIETNYRLDVWTSHAEGPHAEWVLQGAKDGVVFAQSGEDIMQINDWHWLKKRFYSKYSDKLVDT